MRDGVLIAWRGLKLEKNETIQKYIDKFWDLHLKASIFGDIDFPEQRQQYCAGLPEDVCSYITEHKLNSISEVIHRSIVAMKIFSAGKSSQVTSDKSKKVPQKGQAQKDQKGMGRTRRRRKEDTKVPIVSHPRSWIGIAKKTDVSSAVRRVIYTVLAQLSSRIISFNYRSRDVSSMTEDRGNTIPIVSHASLQKSMKKSLFAYMTFVTDAIPSKESNATNEQNESQMNFLKEFKECFSNELPTELPTKRGNEDHRIDLIPRSSPSNKAPYRVSHAQQEEILTQVNELREKVMYESHSLPYAGHRGILATTQAIETYFYWPRMRQDIEDYVTQCIVCQKVKYDRGKAPGLLQPLPIPNAPWQSISMDFIFGLPKSIQGNTGIWTIVDRFSKQAHFLTC